MRRITGDHGSPDGADDGRLSPGKSDSLRLLVRGWRSRRSDKFNDNITDIGVKGGRRKASERVSESTESMAGLKAESESGCEEVLKDRTEEDTRSECWNECRGLEHAEVVNSLNERVRNLSMRLNRSTYLETVTGGSLLALFAQFSIDSTLESQSDTVPCW